MAFSDTMKRDIAALHAAEFKETAVYVPRAGAERIINVVVDREPVAARMEADEGVQVVMSISCNNSATTGISAAEYDIGDKLRIAYRLGTTPKDWPLPPPSLQDDGALTFRINKQ